MKATVVKFGGSSLASAEQIKKAAAIIKADPARRFAVVSAPGKRDSGDTKVTDLLYRCYDLAVETEDFLPVLEQVKARYDDIVKGLDLTLDLTPDMEAIRDHLLTAPQRDYMASRGEYLNAKVISAYLDFPFYDAAELVKFSADGTFLEEETNRAVAGALGSADCAVIPGFYGAAPDGSIRTFSRGGSDITGSIIARGVNAALYENWTDVSGMLFTDPRVVENPKSIAIITYEELRELSYMGASVMHEDAVFPVRKAGIPMNIRNTNRPQDPGTKIVPRLPAGTVIPPVTGIAGRKGFSTIYIAKPMMNGEVGFAAKFLQIIADHGVGLEHCPSGIDTMSAIVETEQLAPVRESILRQMQEKLNPETLYVEDNLTMIAVVGEGMVAAKGIAARVMNAVTKAGVNIRMIDQGSSELNIILGVKTADYEKALRSIYQEIAQ